MYRLAFVARLGFSMEHPVRNFHAELGSATKKPGLLAAAGLIHAA
jgi:hypothetical protein